ncbi:MAG: hypothetical protein NTZ05_01150 [Chloroflexi bacterium]|nr:hypothetical protein [Chloroflexota bacterium]
MGRNAARPHDLLNSGIDAMLRSGACAAAADRPATAHGQEELLDIAEALHLALGTPSASPEAREAGQRRLLSAARRPVPLFVITRRPPNPPDEERSSTPLLSFR